MAKVSVGVIGLGFMGRSHAKLVADSEIADLVAVCDVDAKTAQAAAEATGAEMLQDYTQLLARKDINAVFICTPDQVHLQPALAAIAAGKHVFVEKPVATTVEESKRIAEAARKSGVLMTVGHVLRFDPRYALAHDLVTSGELGEVVSVYARRNTSRWEARRLGGRVSLPLYLGVHDIDLMRWYTGSEVVRVYAESTRKVHTELGVDDCYYAVLKFANGAVGCLELNWALPDSMGGLLDARFEVVGTKKAFAINIQDQGLRVSDQATITWPDTMHWPTMHGKIVGDLKEEVQHFLRCVRDGVQPMVTPEDGVAAVKIARAIEESARTGLPVSL